MTSNPTVFALAQNYPNPFNPSTEIKFELPQNTFVTLKVYNAVGQVVAELVNNEYKNAGRYSVSFDGTKLASGIYFYSIVAGSYNEVKKMVLLK
ncbi:MAG: T9SS type A sorting domain-containing protein [Ignavibacteria bacterium]|nr:T9SS type A sorting domain-containing protein [Ignavibacteria bacterium]